MNHLTEGDSFPRGWGEGLDTARLMPQLSQLGAEGATIFRALHPSVIGQELPPRVGVPGLPRHPSIQGGKAGSSSPRAALQQRAGVLAAGHDSIPRTGVHRNGRGIKGTRSKESVHRETPVSIRDYHTQQQGSSYELRVDLSSLLPCISVAFLFEVLLHITHVKGSLRAGLVGSRANHKKVHFQGQQVK